MVLNLPGFIDQRNFLMVDSYNRSEHLESITRHQKSQVLLAVTLWLSGVVVNQKFTSDEHTHLLIICA